MSFGIDSRDAKPLAQPPIYLIRGKNRPRQRGGGAQLLVRVSTIHAAPGSTCHPAVVAVSGADDLPVTYSRSSGRWNER
jgi:hypothetical protein